MYPYNRITQSRLIMDERIEDLIVKMVDGEIAEKEREELERALASSEEARKALKAYTRVRKKVEAFREKFHPDVERRLEEVKARRKKRVRMTHWIGYAAAVALIVGGGLFFWSERQQPVDRQLAVVQERHDHRAYITWGNGRQLTLDESWQDTLLIEDMKGSVRVDSNRVVRYEAGDSLLNESYKLTIPQGGEYRLELGDRTTVWLNSMSELEVAAGYGDKERRVRLTGEGYFEVSRNEECPFVVETGQLDVRVLGTKFNVAAYGDEAEVRATLVDGSVRVRSREGDSLVLRPGQQAATTGREVTVRNVDVSLVTSWLGGKYVFDNECLERIVLQLSRWYGETFAFVNQDAKKVRFSGSVSKYDSVDEVLERLERTSNVRFTRVGDRILINKR